MILNELSSFSSLTWPKFSEEEFMQAISNCCDSLSPRPNKLLWGYLKCIIKVKTCLRNIIYIANICFKLGYRPSHFKILSTIVISKPNKASYDLLKSFQPIILLNTLGKLIEKVIGERLQFQVVNNNFIHYSQLGRLKFKFTSDTGIMLTHFICIG